MLYSFIVFCAPVVIHQLIDTGNHVVVVTFKSQTLLKKILNSFILQNKQRIKKLFLNRDFSTYIFFLVSDIINVDLQMELLSIVFYYSLVYGCFVLRCLSVYLFA